MSDTTPDDSTTTPPIHVPVLPREVTELLDLTPGLTVVDGTVGAGGHARLIQELIQPAGRLIGLDRDPMMLKHAERALRGSGSTLVHAGYTELPDVLARLQIPAVDRVLLDLGLSSDQLADSERGFSFDSEAALDMRYDTTEGVPAWDIVNRAAEKELARIFYEYGEERYSRRIARRIVNQRPVATAVELARIVRSAVPHPKGRQRIHPATRVFQALRIAANHELQQLETLLDEVLPRCLKPGGRAVFITFHSLEDRLVKQAFRDRNRWKNLTKKPLRASASEQRENPRSRSAKLRAAVKL
ncbi:MAG: 16S rRNA (cytosine(1402)-N(4))-methyltransferase RsmH [Planctomycetota bacterium]|nr:MAG: 16S rRNA (cytosine(1402)-N(4))-methyltransferase RsmH [Planctomycetota bacterium]REJ89508.1 MAG: 16S rRNA (cytosine(1402)-N(4))-methyltransferase RsmH [Planctomycetota bacterium]REK28921.1 MAG: 16S rRNA (cytosine(1402)-N(4))-methyltransferase RsmH [Planctomycetota bacterium]REK39645.1 MAG: 16S rRNA (cytosine(1402)-N(4))-methyltransferase RsmH [Planctomycetota bacterium]